MEGWTWTVEEHHRTCLLLLLRDLNYLAQRYEDFRKMLLDAIDLGREGDPEGYDTGRSKMVQQLQKLLGEPQDRKHRELYTFYRRMCRERQNLFIPEVPPDNNGSERAVRNVKVKQKISGQFKNAGTAQNFANRTIYYWIH